jgi:hypothetical protein
MIIVFAGLMAIVFAGLLCSQDYYVSLNPLELAVSIISFSLMPGRVIPSTSDAQVAHPSLYYPGYSP